jgi:CubicO group peptidase (beta-lactamase class C family)
MPRAARLLSSVLLLTTLAGGARAQGLPPARGAPAFSAAGLARLDSAIQAYVTDGKLAGVVVAIGKDGKVAHWKAFGLRSVEANDPMEPNDLFRIYSMTKPITSTAVMILVEQGKVGLDDPVAKYLPAFAAAKVWTPSGPVPPRRPITVRDLLRHTSGLTYGFFGETAVDSLYRKAQVDAQSSDLADLTARLAGLPLIGHPGEVWNYGYSTDVLGRIVEVASGRSLAEFFAERIFKPLGMDDSFFEVPREKRSRFTGYYARPAGGRFVLADSPDTGSYTKPPKVLSGGGGLVSSTGDYLRFCQMILNGGELDGARILEAKTVREMLRNQLPAGMVPAVGQPLPATGFGLGFNLIVDGKDPLRGSDGTASWAGYGNTYFWIDPVKKVIGIVMAQHYPFAAYPIDEEFRRLVYQALQ